MKHLSLITCFFFLFGCSTASGWYRGSLHVHTNLSDGDSAPKDVVKWYREHGYHFVVLTDHNLNANVRGLNRRFAKEGRFLVLPGNEVTCVSEGKPVHFLALNVTGFLPPYNGKTIVDTVRGNLKGIEKAGALPVVCHPNDGWSLSAEKLLQVEGLRLLEICNCHPTVNNFGGGGLPGTEEIWDVLLTRGRKVWGTASDDMHILKKSSPRNANPGRGWVMVRSDRLTPRDIVSALERGDFYFSTGVELRDLRFKDNLLRIAVQSGGPIRYTVEFIGAGGRVLAKKYDQVCMYRCTGTEGYVRVRITDSNGFRAWTQPFFPDQDQK